jgi:hypothetical protein
VEQPSGFWGAGDENALPMFSRIEQEFVNKIWMICERG